MKRERMTIWDAAAYLAETPLQREIDPMRPFPIWGALRTTAHPKIKKWFSRLRQGTQDGTLAHYRADNNTRGVVYYRADDLDRWARRLFPRQEALNV